MPFNIRQLRYAIAAADHGSFYRAARALDIEQSTLSRAVLKLERSIGTELFVRTRAGVTVTTIGRRFLRNARTMVANADRMLAATRAAGKGRAGGLTLGFNSSVSAGNLRATLVAARQENPDVEIDGIETGRSALFAGLDSGEIDIAILMGEVHRDDFRHASFWSEHVFVAMSNCHALSERDVVNWVDLRDQRFALPTADPGPEIRDMLIGRLWQSGARPDIELHPVNRETILSFLGETGMLSVACEGATGALYPNVVYRPVHGEQGPALVAYSGYWRDDNANPALKRFLAFVRKRYALSFEIGTPTTENIQPSGEAP
ncbi:LysR family transcriptional regulator [Sphingopyxis indica]|uniref:DNA-binding transcriptional regulator, LysR family n=1 Tax=Sphingopyxis indica TaxID=436663 RepID=A0A239IWX7_9SPHN|nr:LysR family transcriptional regulator [Sphingopyxis indica]SNS98110.1 DNA-binding transcriptional regulator, LysR family [Sphingopyxis indica]